MDISAQSTPRDYLSQVESMIRESYPHFGSVCSSEAVQRALADGSSKEVIALRVLSELGREAWKLYKEYCLEHDNSCIRGLGEPAFDVLRLLARSGSEYVSVGYFNDEELEYRPDPRDRDGIRWYGARWIPDNTRLTLKRPFSDYLCDIISRGSGLGCVFPGRNGRNKGNTLVETVAILERRLPR